MDGCEVLTMWLVRIALGCKTGFCWLDTVAHACRPYTWEAEAGSCKFWVSWAHGEIMPQNLLLTDGKSSVLGVLPCRVRLGSWACMSGRLGMLKYYHFTWAVSPRHLIPSQALLALGPSGV